MQYVHIGSILLRMYKVTEFLLALATFFTFLPIVIPQTKFETE